MEEEPPKAKRLEQFLSDREFAGFRNGIVQTYNADFEKHKFCQKDVREHTGCINALRFSHKERLLASGGDDQRSRVWKVDDLISRRAPKPEGVMPKRHESNIFSLEFDLEDRFLFSGERWGVLIKHDVQTKQMVYKTEQYSDKEDVYHLHQNPSDNNLIAVTRNRLISFIDDRDRPNPTQFRPLTPNSHRYYTAEYHPRTACLLLVNSKSGGPNIYDLRMALRPVYKRSYNSFRGAPPDTRQSPEWMGSMWSPSGNQFMSLRNGASPVYFDLISKRCFHLNSDEYLNKKTLKSMTFIDDHTVATGSDRWGIHVWRLPRADQECGFLEIDRLRSDRHDLVVEKEINTLRGHRSIPNQVRFSPVNQLLASSGVENMVKLWSHRRLPWSYDVPFPRNKSGTYEGSVEMEAIREQEERRVLETALDEMGELEGRATWEDVFGGNVQTCEDRETVEMFDVADAGDDEDGLLGVLIRAADGEVIRRRHLNFRNDPVGEMLQAIQEDPFAEYARNRALLRLFRGHSDEDFSSESDDENDSDRDEDDEPVEEEQQDQEEREHESGSESEDEAVRNDFVSDFEDEEELEFNRNDDEASIDDNESHVDDGDEDEAETDSTVSPDGDRYFNFGLDDESGDDDNESSSDTANTESTGDGMDEA